jgi:hypothetical protein
MRKKGYLAALLALIVIGCAHHQKASVQDKQDGKTLWEHRYQYVRLVPQDHCQGAQVIANSHPQDLDGRLRPALASLRIDLPDLEKTAPVFTRSELEQATGPLLQAFRMAAPDEDVAIAIEGAHPGNYGFHRSIITARLFIQNGDELHVIFGKLHDAVDDYDSPWHAEPTDYRIKPFEPGSRCQKAGKEFPAIIASPGVQFQQQEGTARKNWLAISLSAPPQPTQAPMPMAMPPATQPPTVTAPPAVHGTEAVMPKATEPLQKSLEEKLQILKNLKDKGLISDQEYQEKKKEILDSL